MTAHMKRTCEQLAETANAELRALIHQTRPCTSELDEPADLAAIIATLAELTGMLPQLLTQLTG